MASQVDLIIVISSQNSSHSSRLREVAEKSWTTACMVDTDANRFVMDGRENARCHRRRFGAGVLVQIVIDRLRECGAKSVRTLEGVKERVTFPLSKGLSKLQIAWNASQPDA
jgi:4-hydroxy-3-methylbut-2-en-1-yl diphosphate reductase